jgi:Siphovirus Gp157.
MTLYQLTDDWLKLYELMSEPADEDTEDVILDTIEGIDGAIEDKADGYAKIPTQLAGDSELLKEQIDRLTARKKAIDNNAKKLKENLQKTMELTGKTKFKTNLFSFGIQNNPAAVAIDDESEVPDEYLIPQPSKIDKTAIKDALKAGEILSFAHLEQTQSLRIR